MSVYKIYRAELNDETGQPIPAKKLKYEEVLINFGTGNGVQICFDDEQQADLARTYLSEADSKGYYKIVTVKRSRKSKNSKED